MDIVINTTTGGSRPVPVGSDLTASVVHGVNNALLAVLGHATVARRHMQGNRQALLALEAIEQAVREIGLLPAFSGSGRHAGKSRVHLGELAKTEGARLGQVAPESVDVEIRVSDHAHLWVVGSEGALRQVVLGVGALVLESVPHDGRLLVAASHTGGSHGGKDQPRVMLTVAAVAGVDGAEGGVQETPRAASQTTRVAMSAVRQVVAEHNAEVFVSTQERGLSISVAFPPAPAQEPEQEGVSSGELLLLVSEDRQVRAIIAAALDGSGHAVLQASDSNEALSVATEHDRDISMVILDADLPGAAGPECLRALRGGRPDLLSVAFGRDPAPVQDLVTEFLRTPLSLSELTGTVERTLLGRSGH